MFKKLLFLFSVLALSLYTVACGDDDEPFENVKNFNELPQQAQSFINDYFSTYNISSIVFGEGGYVVDEFLVFGAVVVGARGKLLVKPVETCVHLVDRGESLAHLLDYGQGVGDGHVLRQITYGHALRNRHRTRCGVLESGYYLEHR